MCCVITDFEKFRHNTFVFTTETSFASFLSPSVIWHGFHKLPTTSVAPNPRIIGFSVTRAHK